LQSRGPLGRNLLFLVVHCISWPNNHTHLQHVACVRLATAKQRLPRPKPQAETSCSWLNASICLTTTPTCSILASSFCKEEALSDSHCLRSRKGTCELCNVYLCVCLCVSMSFVCVCVFVCVCLCLVCACACVLMHVCVDECQTFAIPEGVLSCIEDADVSDT
jgi:hypothetical protein